MSKIIKAFSLIVIGLITYNIITYKNNSTMFFVQKEYFNSYNKYQIPNEVIKEQTPVIVTPHQEIDTIKPIEQKPIQDKDIIKEPIKEPQPPIKEPEETYKPLETVVGNMSGYGPDCYGCTSNKTASGYYVGAGNIYYNDQTYGKIRILAADRKYSFGTIVRVSNPQTIKEPFYAIVLDYGGAIGLNQYIQFDLLYEKEALASVDGIKTNVLFEIVRNGY